MSSVPKEVQEIIISRARTEWPEDYEMQIFVAGRQTAAYQELREAQDALKGSGIATSIAEYAARSWPDDFEMQLFALREQQLAFMKFMTYKNSSIPQEVLNQIKVRAHTYWPGDYKMRMFELEVQVAAWLHLNDGGAKPDSERMEMLHT